MVILTAAVAGAAGYGVYKGGEAGVRKVKETHKKIQRDGRRRQARGEMKTEFKAKSEARKERISQIESARSGRGGGNRSGGDGLWSMPTTTSSAPAANNPSSTASSSTSRSSLSVEARHKAVMAKLRNDKPKSRFRNPFQRK